MNILAYVHYKSSLYLEMFEKRSVNAECEMVRGGAEITPWRRSDDRSESETSSLRQSHGEGELSGSLGGPAKRLVFRDNEARAESI